MPERVLNLRGIEGINRQENQRLDDPHGAYSTVNLFARVPDILADRPGTRLILDGRHVTLGGKIVGSGIVIKPGAGNLGIGESITPISPTYFSRINGTFPRVNDLSPNISGLRGVSPRALSGGINVHQIPTTVPGLIQPIAETPLRVAGLTRLYVDQGLLRFWVGAYNWGGHQDRLFYINSAGQAQLLDDVNITSHGGDFFFLNMGYRDPGAGSSQAYYGIGTNQLNQPFSLKYDSSTTILVQPAILDACRGHAWDGIALGSQPANTIERITHVQHICEFNNAVVYGGYHTLKPSDGTEVNKCNFICFSDTGKPHAIAEKDTIILDIRIGASESEPVTAVGTTVTAGNVAGVQGLLVAMTARRVVIFQGIPPTTDNPTTDFVSIVTRDSLGCNAPKTVVTTPAGLIFLGSDGMVYLIPAYQRSGPVPIGRHIWDILRGMTPRQQRQCSAYWHPRGYYVLSYPETDGMLFTPQKLGPIPRVHPATNNRQLWADFRQAGQGEDLNVKWFGPHVGMSHNCFAVALGAEDRGEIYAGSSVDGTIIECWQEHLVSDPDPVTPTNTNNFSTLWATGVEDMGEASVDKEIAAVHLGVTTNKAVNILTGVVPLGAFASDDLAAQFVDPVAPPPQSQLGFMLLGSGILTPHDKLQLNSDHPAQRVVGRAVRLEIRKDQTSGAQVAYSDLEIRYNVLNRRP